MADKRYDLVLFGATGFTGGLTAQYLARAATARPLRWALAGRNRSKLEQVRAQLQGPNGKPDVLEADAMDESALIQLARATQVVVSTVGPYLRYGEPLVRACASEGADYVDLTGENLFVDHTLERYHALAEQNRARIVHSCGFDSIPYDLGTYFALKRLSKRAGALDGQSVQVECLVRAKGMISGGTWHSGLGIMAELREHRRDAATREAHLPKIGAERSVRLAPMRIRFRRELDLWGVPFPSIDPEVVCRSARLLPWYGRDFRYGHYIGLKNVVQVAGMLAGVSAVFTLAQFAPTRRALMALIKPGTGPSEERRKRSWFRVLLLASAGEHQVRCEVSGGDPGYGETSKMLAESGLCLALDRERLPTQYGVIPPAAAMGEALLERLVLAGIRFEDQSPEPMRAIEAKAPTQRERERRRVN